jgi:hypothetical protein
MYEEQAPPVSPNAVDEEAAVAPAGAPGEAVAMVTTSQQQDAKV